MFIDEVRKQNFKHLFEERGPNSTGSLFDVITPLTPFQHHHNLHHISTWRPGQSSAPSAITWGRLWGHRCHPGELNSDIHPTGQQLKSSAVTSWRKAGAEQGMWPQLPAQCTGWDSRQNSYPNTHLGLLRGTLNTGKKCPRPPHLWAKSSLWALPIQHKLSWHYLLFPCNLVH